MQLVLAYIFSILILYGNVIYRPIMSLTTGNIIKIQSNMKKILWSLLWTIGKKSAICHIKVTEPIKIAKLSYFIVYLE